MNGLLAIILLVVSIPVFTAAHIRISRMLPLEKRIEARRLVRKNTYRAYDWFALILLTVLFLAGRLVEEEIGRFGYAFLFLYSVFVFFRGCYFGRSTLQIAAFPKNFIDAQFAFGITVSALYTGLMTYFFLLI